MNCQKQRRPEGSMMTYSKAVANTQKSSQDSSSTKLPFKNEYEIKISTDKQKQRFHI